MSQKFLYAFAFLAAYVTIVQIGVEARHRGHKHGLILGERRYGDVLLFRQVVYKKGRFPFRFSKEINFVAPKRQIITFVSVQDLYTNGKGARVKVTRGGPGDHEVSIHFRSKRGHGIDFIVEIYGY